LLSKKILIVENNADLCEMLIVLLTLEGFTVKTAENGQEALRLVESDQPDLIITDINMPKLDGIGLIKRLGQDPRFESTPIVALSAYQGFKQQALEAGANEFFLKPTDIEELIEAINRLLPS
jgi:two-component system chemotaxis response regulator CheY